MAATKTTRIVYWVSTALIALSLLPSLILVKAPESVAMSKNLGVPDWLHWELAIGKGIGAVLLILPMVGKRLKEWTYVALGIDFISAFIALVWVMGFKLPDILFPVITFAILLVSYTSYHKLNKN